MFTRDLVTWGVIAALVAAPGVARGQEALPVPETVPIASPGLVAPGAPVPVPQDMSRGPAIDTVTLRDGGVIRGTVAESFPGRHVTIVSAAGEKHTIAWDQVADVGYGGSAAPAVPPPLLVGPGRPRLHIELSRDATVRLYELTGTIMVASTGVIGSSSTPHASTARPVCMAPCDRVIDATGGQSFFFGGDRVTPSRRFTLIDHGGDMTAVVKPGRMGLFFGGVLMTTMSLAPLISGSVFLGIRPSTMSTTPTSLNRTGGVLLGVGAGMLVSGIIMLALGRTRVELYRKMTGAAQRRDRGSRM